MLLLCNSGPLMALGIIAWAIVASVLLTIIGKGKWF